MACIMNSDVEPNLFTESLCMLNRATAAMDGLRKG